MLSFGATQRIYLAVEPVDMRKQFNGLWALAVEKLKEDPFSGALFVFTNEENNRVKSSAGMEAGCGWRRSDWKKADSPGRC